jgi:thioredoxin 1
MNKNNKNLLALVIGIIVVVGVSFVVFAAQNNPAIEKQDVVEKVQEISEEINVSEEMPITDEGSDMAPTPSSTDTPSTTEESTPTSATGSYEAYSADKIAQAADGTVVLFFHAAWCPSCRALNANIEANRSEIPSGVSILKADYDEETELRKKYGVTTQHTLVQVDKDGNLIKKWSGGSTLDSIISQIN